MCADPPPLGQAFAVVHASVLQEKVFQSLRRCQGYLKDQREKARAGHFRAASRHARITAPGTSQSGDSNASGVVTPGFGREDPNSSIAIHFFETAGSSDGLPGGSGDTESRRVSA
jgi:hypothetical protein